MVGGQGKENGLSLRYAVKHRHHIRGRGGYVGIPSDLSTAAIEVLVLDNDQLEYLCNNPGSCGH